MVRFVVDDYHHRVHREIGMRPYEAWERADNRLAPPLDHVQTMLAFGMRLQGRSIGREGVRFLHIPYKNDRYGSFYGEAAKRKLAIVVDPHDLGEILVRVPEDLKPAYPGAGDYLVFSAQGFEGVSLAEHLRGNRALRAFEKAEHEAGRPFRLGVLRDFNAASAVARARAGVPADELTQKAFEAFVRFMERDARAITAKAKPTGEETGSDAGPDDMGKRVAGGAPLVGAREGDADVDGEDLSYLEVSPNRFNEEGDA